MFNKEDLYEFLMEINPDNQSDQMIWVALATKLYLDTSDKESNKLFDVMEKAKRYNLIIPDDESAKGWNFIKDHVEGKISTPEELEKLVIEHGFTATTSN